MSNNSRWVNHQKNNSEDDIPAYEPIGHSLLFPFGHYTRQIGKKRPSKKLKKDRVSEKSLLLSARITQKKNK